MNLTKDEARILASILADAKFEQYDRNIPGWNSFLDALEFKLKIGSKDFRRKGRTSLDGWDDLQKRVGQKHLEGGQS
jgi:hypothetical protein